MPKALLSYSRLSLYSIDVHETRQCGILLPMILVRSQIKNMLGGEIGKITWEE